MLPEAGSYPVYESFESFCLAILQGWWRSKVHLWRELRVQGYMARKLHQERFEAQDGQFLKDSIRRAIRADLRTPFVDLSRHLLNAAGGRL